MTSTISKRVHLAMGIFAMLVLIVRFILAWDKNAIPPLYYFTVQTNLMVALYWLWIGLGNNNLLRRLKIWIAGAVTTYITITSIVYITQLHSIYMELIEFQLAMGYIKPWQYYTSIVMTYLLHVVIPAMMIADYLLFTPSQTGIKPYQWLMYPLLYGILHTVYGLVSGRYIYPFLNPEKVGGWLPVLRNVAYMFVFILALAYILYGLNLLVNKSIAKQEIRMKNRAA